MKEKEKIRLGISIGDPNGIGCEVALKTFEDSRMLDFCTPVIFASNKMISSQKNHLGIDIRFNGVKEPAQAVDGKVNVVNISKNDPKLDFGQATSEAGAYAIESLTAAVKSLKQNHVDLLVTAPINKNNVQSETFTFPGHTDYLNQELEGDSLMFMITDGLKVGLLTDHIAVKEVAQSITPKLIREKVKTIEKSLRMDFGIR
ncbi:MAG: 4-hydroxythreonine-4-phosphate dehydrogenase PdxA, partial [Bacteroidota bacterium]